MSVAAFREAYRAEHIGRSYSGVLHFTFTSVGSLAVVALAIANVKAPKAFELCTVPITFFFANFVEYRGHKGPMHGRVRGLDLLFERHTQQHHRYFTHETMAYETTRDFKMVLFPPVMLLFFLGGVATPIAALLFFTATRNVALLFVATAVAYFLTYEWLHLCHHARPDGWLGKFGLLRVLRAHHRAHHDPANMTRGNFNITFPVCDAIFGTRLRASTEGG